MTAGDRLPDPDARTLKSLPKILGRKRIYILPTGQGLVFGLILGGILIGSLNYNNNLGFLLSFLLGSMVFVSLIHTYKNLAGIRILSVRAAPVFAGENALFEILAGARGARPAVRFTFPETAETDGDLPADRKGRFRTTAPARQRGLLDPGLLTVSTRYPFGLFRAWSRLDTGVRGLVYPRPAAGPFNPGTTDTPDNDKGHAATPGADDFEGLRAYQAGDSLQRIYWKSFSRGMGLHTKSFVGQAGTAVQLDWQSINSADPERRLSRLCDMVLKAHVAGQTYGLALPGKTIPPGRGAPHKRRCLKTLALYQAFGGGAP